MSSVYCRPHYSDEPAATHRGIRLQTVSSIETKHFDALSHALACTVRAIRDGARRHPLPRGRPGPRRPAGPAGPAARRVVLTVHGLDAERDKWGRGARAVLDLATWMCARVPHRDRRGVACPARHYPDT